MSSGLGELFVELGTIGNVKDLEKFVAKVKEGATAIEKHMKLNDTATKATDNSLKGLINRVGRFKVAITAAIYLMNRFTNELVRSNQEFLQLTRQSDIALSTFNKWDSVGKMFGIQNVAGQIENLNKRLFELRLTGQGARGFQLAGIDPTGLDAEGIFERLRSRIQGMSNTQASYILEQMGLDPNLITILRLGRDEFENLWATVRRYNLTNTERKDIEKLNVQLQICFIKLKYIKDKAVLALLPAWRSLVQSFTRLAEGVFALNQWVEGIMNMKVGVKTLGEVIQSILVPALFALLAVTNPVYAIFLALYLIIDDFVAYMQGKRSLIGYFLEWIERLEDRINFESPKWLKDLLLIVQKADQLGNAIDKIRGKSGDGQVSTGRTGSAIIQQVTPVGMTLQPLSIGSNFGNWLNKHFGTIEERRGIKNTTINMTNNIVTDQPAETIENEISYLQYGDALR